MVILSTVLHFILLFFFLLWLFSKNVFWNIFPWLVVLGYSVVSLLLIKNLWLLFDLGVSLKVLKICLKSKHLASMLTILSKTTPVTCWAEGQYVFPGMQCAHAPPRDGSVKMHLFSTGVSEEACCRAQQQWQSRYGSRRLRMVAQRWKQNLLSPLSQLFHYKYLGTRKDVSWKEKLSERQSNGLY